MFCGNKYWLVWANLVKTNCDQKILKNFRNGSSSFYKAIPNMAYGAQIQL